MQLTRKRTSRTKLNFLIDIIIFTAFLVAMDPRLTGIAIHEWLSIAFGAAIIVHLLLHWQWRATPMANSHTGVRYRVAVPAAHLVSLVF